MRPSWDKYFMSMAHVAALRSTCDRGPELKLDPGRHGVGCVITKDNRIVSTGYNGSCPKHPHCSTHGHLMADDHCVRTIHSELNAILYAAKHGISLDGSTIYTTASPCYDCAKAIISVGIKRVVYNKPYESRYGLSSTVTDLLTVSGIQIYRFDERVQDESETKRSGEMEKK